MRCSACTASWRTADWGLCQVGRGGASAGAGPAWSTIRRSPAGSGTGSSRPEQQSDLDQAVAGYTEDVEHDVVGAPDGPLRGPAAARQRYTQLLEQVRTDRLTELRRFYGAGRVEVHNQAG